MWCHHDHRRRRRRRQYYFPPFCLSDMNLFDIIQKK
jgi:hypothetical protein